MSAGWYPDPLGRAELRRHDGTVWTHDVAIDGVQQKEAIGLPLSRREPVGDPLPAPIPMPAPAATATAAPPSSPPPYVVTRRPAPVQSGGDGLLIAAGVLTIVTGAVELIEAIGLLDLATKASAISCRSAAFCPFGALSAGAALGGFLALAFAAAFLTAGIGACMRTGWGQISVVALGAVGVVFAFAATVAVQSILGLIPMLWFGTIAGLAFANNRIGRGY